MTIENNDNSSNKLQFVFIGQNSGFSVKTLKAISERHTLKAIVECAPRGYKPPSQVGTVIRDIIGKKLTRLARLAASEQVPYFFLTRHNKHELGVFLKNVKADVGCIASMPQLLPEPVLHIPEHGFINLHPSLLPKYRGANPQIWHFYYNEGQSGVSVIKVDAGEDTGDILVQKAFDIPLGATSEWFQSQIIDLGAQAMIEALDAIATGNITLLEQRHLSCSRKARRLKPSEKLVDWENWTAQHVYHFLRGGMAWHQELRAVPGFRWKAVGFDETASHYTPGTIAIDRKGFYVAHRSGKIRLTLKPALKTLLITALRWAQFV